jgi:hypothetical protein
MFVALCIYLAKRMRHILLSPVARLAALPHKRRDFRISCRISDVYFDFFTKFILYISYSKEKWERYDQKYVLVFL